MKKYQLQVLNKVYLNKIKVEDNIIIVEKFFLHFSYNLLFKIRLILFFSNHYLLKNYLNLLIDELFFYYVNITRLLPSKWSNIYIVVTHQYFLKYQIKINLQNISKY